MQHAPEISFSFLATQTCTNCQLPVTCGPVYVVNDLSITCGRCRVKVNDHFRNYAYEALASTFIYPCKNWRNHCPVKLRWNDSLDHESECNYIGCCTFFCRHPGSFIKGPRDIPRDDVKLTVVPEILLEHLECVICRGYLNSSPIFIQSNGQNVCHRCIYNNGNPPNCRRNHAYENFSQIFLFPCTFRSRGCREKMQFGRAIWKHEAICEYAPNQQTRPSLKPQQSSRPSFRQSQTNGNIPRPKEKGIIKTHTGHIWATITPQKALFAPPDDDMEDANRKLLKSLARKQGRQIKRADEIGQEMNGGRNSDSESISTNDSYSMKTSQSSTPEPFTKKPYIPPMDYNSRPNSRESGYQTSPNKYVEEFGYNPLRPNESFREYNGPGQFPVLLPHQLSDGFDSIRRQSKRESKGNQMLMNELRVKQDQIRRTHSIKAEKDVNSPYRQCNNLEDIREVNRQLR